MEQFLFTSELQHFLVTLVIALFLYWRYRNWRLIPICFFFGFFIDLDHWFDYFAYYGLKGNPIDFFDVVSYMESSGKIYVPLHGWEYIPIFALLGKIFEKRFKIKGLMWAIILPYGLHLFLDHFSFSHHPLAYSFIYRLLNNFSLQSFNNLL